MTKNHHLLFMMVIFLISGLLDSSCKKATELPSDPNYPATIHALSPADLIKALFDYFVRNNDILSSLNGFGFCAHSTFDKEYALPEKKENISREEAITLTKNFIARNPQQTGIYDTSSVTFRQIDYDEGYDGSSRWFLQTTNQKYDSMEVLYSEVLFEIVNGKLIQCVGNYFPQIYVPAKFSVSQEMALHKLIGKECGLCTIAGVCPSRKVKEPDLVNAEINIVIYPLSNGSSGNTETRTKIELRVTYKIYLPAASYIFYLDVMDGSLVASEPTVFS